MCLQYPSDYTEGTAVDCDALSEGIDVTVWSCADQSERLFVLLCGETQKL